jgi:hypothetical protein
LIIHPIDGLFVKVQGSKSWISRKKQHLHAPVMLWI